MKDENRAIKKRYDAVFLAVKSAIDEWNPYGLLPDAPDDEFDGESRSVASQIFKCGEDISVNKIALMISIVFTDSFGQDFEAVKCVGVATKIKSAL
jgi:hypothetical protein